MKRLPNRTGMLLLLASVPAWAADAAPPVVKVGREAADAAAVARALGRVPAFQLSALGTDDASRRRAVVERLLVPELQGAAEARARGLDQRLRFADRERELLARAMEAELARETARAAAVTDADVQSYFEQHRDRFETPRRIRIWRIQVADEALASKIIEAAKGPGGPKRWGDFARENSLDTATKLRDGDLGFVRPDGSTETPRVRVDPALFAAVDKLRDGELAPAPLPLHGGYAVVWRRGSLPAISRTAQQEGPAIRTLLTRERAEAGRATLLESLRKGSLSALDTQLLETLPDALFASPDAARALPALPDPTPAAAGAETPKPGDRGTR
ncbi:MAG TPA: peptidyl-prolyl cis-trans isomerase [Polyangiaceae bacterium]